MGRHKLYKAELHCVGIVQLCDESPHPNVETMTSKPLSLPRIIKTWMASFKLSVNVIPNVR